MRYLRRRLELTPTWMLAAYVACADVLLCFGIVPFELYCRSVLAQHHAGTVVLVGILAVNAVLILILAGAMLASTGLIARGAKRTALAVVPAFYRKRHRTR